MHQKHFTELTTTCCLLKAAMHLCA